MFDLTTTRILHSPEATPTLHPWVWPLPILNGFSPTILEDGHDLEPARRDLVVGYEPRVALPEQLPVFAARDGVITYAAKDENAFSVAIDHPGGWITQYSGLFHLCAVTTDRFRRRRKERVRAGDVLGFIHKSSACVRFELARFTEDGHQPVPPVQRMRTWIQLSLTDVPRSRPSSQQRPSDQDIAA